MNTIHFDGMLRKALAASLMCAAGLASAATTVNLTAQRATATLPDGVSVPMWQFCGALDATATNAGSVSGGACPAAPAQTWSPGPTITVPVGDTLTINLTNKLNVPTSIVVLGQLGGGLGAGTRMASPAHNGQAFTTFPGNGQVDPGGEFKPPLQGTRVQSFGTEAPQLGAVTLTFANLKPGTYLYETGTLPSLEAPMGLYGLLIVTQAPVTTPNFIPGDAYAGASTAANPTAYDSDAALLFSEIDPVQNAQVDKAEQAAVDITKNLRFNDPSCGVNCYPAAVNYTPTYFLINGQAFDRTQPGLSSWAVGANYQTGKILLRLANAGSRTHIPSVVGLPMMLVGEDGNVAPGKAKQQNEVLLTAGKTYDVLVSPSGSVAASYTKATVALFDRQGSLSTANQPDGGMQGYLLVGGGANGNGTAPAIAGAMAVNDAYSVAVNTAFNGNVKLNDVAVKTVAVLVSPSHGTLALNPDGTFTYTPTAGYNGTDSFTYNGNGGATNTATVTLSVGSPNGVPKAVADSYSSNIASILKVFGPGVLANDSDPGNLALSVDTSSYTNVDCGSVAMTADGGFTVTRGGAASCSFSYKARNSQGAVSAAATVTVSFATGSGLKVNVVDAKSGTAITDYRWVIQEDLTFKPDVTGTPSLTTRTLGTSFHRAHNTVVASGCVGAVSCGTDQQVRGVKVSAGPSTLPGDVALDPTRHYYISVLPGDAQNPVLNGGGGPVTNPDGSVRKFDLSKDCLAIGNPADPCGHMMGGTNIDAQQMATQVATITLQRTPLVPAQLSIYIYEDNNPTNGQNDLNENGLGGFNIILFDPVGRSGDPAGQQTYDAFNMPITNALLGTPGCPDDQNATTAANSGHHIAGIVYTCPNAPNPLPPGRTAADYSLAGHALIQNITPARYDVIAHPGADREGAGEVWWQTETLEGTPAQDAFTGINEARYFQEFGPPGFHTTIGFVNPKHIADFATSTQQTGTHTITGQVTNQHMSRPSQTTLWDSGSYDVLASTNCRVALNAGGGTGATIATAECDGNGGFTLTGVPAGSYEVAIFDQWLDQIIQTAAVTVPDNVATVAMGNIPVLSWFTQHDQYQLLDDGSGKLTPIPNVNMIVRYRNGSISNQTLTDTSGNGILVELFPLFNWYVSESDTTRFKQKQVNITVDGGGKVDATGNGAGLITSTYPTGESTIRTETPGAYSYGIQGFISQRNKIEWIKAPYVAGENGGIQGTVVYSSTRAFDDQRWNVQTIWEPLVPRVTVNLYQRVKNADGSVTLTKVDSTLTSSWDDWVNTVYGADSKPYILGPDQKLRDPVTGALAAAGAYPPGKQVNMSCPGQLPGPAAGALPPFDTTQVDPFANYTLKGDLSRCYDGFHVWNQVQAAPYDGKYQFPSAAYVAAHQLTAAQVAAGQTLVSLPPGDYVVEAVTPPGYEIAKEEDKNILIGDAFIAPVVQQFGGLGSIFILPDQATLNNANPNNPSTGDAGFQSNPTSNLGATSSMMIFPECVGDMHRVPDFLSLFPQAQQVAPFAGMDRPLCDKKLVKLGDQMQASATFFVYTGAPVAANATGIILDDASAEFNAASPDFGEKASVPFVPVSTKDFTGHEVSRVYSDQWGAYNLMLPSSWLVNPPTPSGYGPNMMVNCINDPGPIAATNAAGQWIDANGVVVTDVSKAKMITDPAYNPAYSNFCYTNPFMPGQATYLDTPVLPIAAFAGGYNPTDCAYPDATPAIARVDSDDGFGPYVSTTLRNITITALGDQQVPNPAYAGPFATSGPASQNLVTRHYGFGTTKGTVKIGNVTVPAANITTWNDTTVVVKVPSNAVTGELTVTSAGGKSSVDAVTVTVGGKAPTRVQGALGQTIQAAIDNAAPGDLILVDAGTYNELVIMWKPVRLQGVGAASVIINAAKYPTTKLDVWRPRINAMFGIDTNTGNAALLPQVDPLPGQEVTGGVVLLEPSVLGTEEGAGITVLAKGYRADGVTPLTNSLQDCAYTSQTVAFNLDNGANTVAQPGLSNFLCAASRIDGLSVTGGDAGGGIYVNGWAHNLEIANNRVYGNAGALHGGVRVGVPYLEIDGYPGQVTNTDGTLGGTILRTNNVINGLGYDKSVKIHHNAITKNGVVEGPAGNGGAGGGVSICTGTDGYSVDHNWICGNYSQSDGGGIGHLGFSQGGSIAFNQILFNQSFQQTASTHGGGIFVGGEPPLAQQTRTLGTGNVTIDANVITGNFAEAGHGGGVRLQQVNGADVQNFKNTRASWNTVTVTNNIVSNNVAGWSGGGIALADALVSVVDNNTIAANDSVGIAGPLLTGGALPSTTTPVGTGRPNPAGVSSEPNSALLVSALSGSTVALTNAQKAISSPDLVNNIVWHNRAFFYKSLTTGPSLCASNDVTNASSTCVTLPAQTKTGECTGSPAYWDLGVLGDASVAPSATALNPTYSVLSSTGGYSGALAHNSQQTPNLQTEYCNGSRVTPEYGAIINPPAVLNMQVAATIDEGNNYVNLRYGPLSLINAATGATVGNYHLASTATASNSSAVDHGTTGVSTHDVDGQGRPQNGIWDIGADEVPVPSPAIDFNPTSLVFASRVLGTTSAAQQIVVTNTGSANLVFNASNGVTVSGNFAVTSTTCNGAVATTLAPGATCVINVTFTPTVTLGAKSGQITVRDNAAGSPQTVTLSGTAIGAVTVSPSPLAFGGQAVGTTSATQLVTFTNNLATPVTFSAGNGVTITTSPTSTSVPQGEFVIVAGSTTCASGAAVPAGGQCVVAVQFKPTGLTNVLGLFGVRVGTLTFRDNVPAGAGANSPQTVTLTGLAQ